MALEAGAQKKVSDLEEQGDVAGLEALKTEAEQVDMDFEAAGAIEEAIGRLKAKAESVSQTTPEEDATIASVGGTPEEVGARTADVDQRMEEVAAEAEQRIATVGESSVEASAVSMESSNVKESKEFLDLLKEIQLVEKERGLAYSSIPDGTRLDSAYVSKLKGLIEKFNQSAPIEYRGFLKSEIELYAKLSEWEVKNGGQKEAIDSEKERLNQEKIESIKEQLDGELKLMAGKLPDRINEWRNSSEYRNYKDLDEKRKKESAYLLNTFNQLSTKEEIQRITNTYGEINEYMLQNTVTYPESLERSGVPKDIIKRFSSYREKYVTPAREAHRGYREAFGRSARLAGTSEFHQSVWDKTRDVPIESGLYNEYDNKYQELIDSLTEGENIKNFN